MTPDLWASLYIAILAAFTGFEVIARVPALLHTPLMSGSNFIHGIVLVGAILALGRAQTPLETSIGFLAVAIASANVLGGYAVTARMLDMFESGKKKPGAPGVR